MKRKLLLLAYVFSWVSFSYAQTESPIIYPKIGSICPDFVLHNIRHFSKKQAALKDFRRKWLILDFWNKGCSACVKNFPNVSAMQKEFGSKVQFMMVGIQDAEKQIEPMYEKYRAKEHLEMPCAFDSLLANHWDIFACPHIFVIDDKGIVQGITEHLDSDEINGFLQGEHPNLISVYDPGDTVDHKMRFDAQKPFLLNNNGGMDTDFMFRSVLSKFKLSKQHWSTPDNIGESASQGRFQVLGMPLYCLFNYAYFGTWLPGGWNGDSISGQYRNLPVLEMKDSSLFQYSYDHDKNLFGYSLIMPPSKASVQALQKTMQDDLLHYFGYDAKIETRKCSYWRLVATEDAKGKLKTKGGAYCNKATKSGFIARNWPFESLKSLIYYRFPYEVVFDETMIQGNIDITVTDDVWPTIQDAKKALQACGLDLVASEKEMKVVVISDSKQ